MMIKISVTKEIYRRSMMCGVIPEYKIPGYNCAVALAILAIAPKASVGCTHIHWLFQEDEKSELASPLPKIAIGNIGAFDSLTGNPSARLDLPEFSFEVDFPDELVEQIGIDQVREILTNSETLQLVEI